MRLPIIAAFALGASVSSQLVLPLHRGPGRPPTTSVHDPDILDGDDSQQQHRLANPATDSAQPEMVSPAPPKTNKMASVMLSDIMGRDKSINIFAGFARNIEAVSNRLDDATRNSTVLAPLNSQIEKLPRKPWEDAGDYSALGANAYEGGDGQERAQRNMRRFVEAHIVPESPWPAGEKVKSVGGQGEVWWEERDGRKVLQPGDIEVASTSTVANGEVWIIKGVLGHA